MISIYILTYNEEVMLPFTINFYRTRFPGCNITLYDNQSTDSTLEIAEKNMCNVICYDTGNKLSDSAYLQIKNSCYKQAKTDWVLVCDTDELLEINQYQLGREKGFLIRSQAFHMVNLKDDLDIKSITHGVRDKNYDKILLFNRAEVSVAYSPGAHLARVTGNRVFGKVYKLLHYKYLNPDYLVSRYKIYGERLSEDNKVNSWGGQFLTPEVTIRNQFDHLRKQAKKII